MSDDTTTAMEQLRARDSMDRFRARLRVANPVPPPPDYLVDRVLRGCQRIVAGDDPVFCIEDAESGSVKRTRKPTVASVIRQMRRAGVEVAGCEINPRDGTVRVISGKPVEMKADDDRNEWDTVQ